ncbi:methionyl-tRNA formyltransferase [Corynebacterium lizhenjunii]|uniref:Methionyl-tRNA formyltransferase n=1 Tax=Corynebacterium lizhenjunii TaxID=2709394 RepID=A0A7T0P8Y0_9CORY|nr:methionyl-tRNA formyltransferase [Corynebacterium lizhenjunii]QPK78193.1 methionyl-tRNA formyltransferase [Corynebacterium lizhenjunii]
MRIVFAGTPEPAVPALEALIASEHEVVAVITRPDARRGRGRSLHPSPVKEVALKQGIEVLTPSTLGTDTPDGQSLRTRLAELAPEAIPVVAYGNLISADLLAVPTHGWVNLHFSLLPRWRGAAPVQAAIAAGDEYTGATTFRIDKGLDTGEVLRSLRMDIGKQDTADALLERLAYAGANLLVETMDALGAGTANPVPQEGEATYAPKILPEDARIDWTQKAGDIDRHIRAHTPAPGAWTTWDNNRVKVGPVQPLSAATLSAHPQAAALHALQPGQLLTTKQAVFLGTGDLPVELGQIQPPGKKMMLAADWARGAVQDDEVTFA